MNAATQTNTNVTVLPGAQNQNSQIWDRVQATDPAYTKSFTRGGGFRGTAINATFLAKKATEVFGPCGIGWGVEVLEERYQEGAPLGFTASGDVVGREIVHIARIELWYNYAGQRGSVKHFGQTIFVGKNKSGFFTDEEAPKKSQTDGMSKCLSLLGFASDVHLGLYDDNTYVSDLRAGFAAAPVEPVSAPQQAAAVSDVSARYQKYCARFDSGVPVADVLNARNAIQSDAELSPREKNRLLSHPKLVIGG